MERCAQQIDPALTAAVATQTNVLNDIYSEVCDGDTVYLYESSEYGDPAYEFPLHVLDRYLGEFEFTSESIARAFIIDTIGK